MDNLTLEFKKEKIIIKKGVIKIKTFYKYLAFLIIFLIFFIILSLRNENEIRDNLCIYNFIKNTYVIIFYKINLCILVLLLFLFATSLIANLWQEKIEIDKRIKIYGINYEEEFDYKCLKEIKIYHFFETNYNFLHQGTYYSHFKDKCTIGFILKDNKKYKWGYRLSEKKAEEIKKILENTMEAELNG